ncbi:hypothetical protein NLM33_04745 [Bradyrhizobium sp. CCGUVB1N3]|uniref:hypothetical protein n=1 Tax=Bradyrhizobium sp. CCGUVB1N3 TaxID=2949629 RepID=UPI0020B40895|nr:hypothetical protein [Bradyrhizobium sp. CCGUVB1N3]MCP3469637.1 hypothetical protein [Bradyrhizobium sp. CCGUVB1N3]
MPETHDPKPDDPKPDDPQGPQPADVELARAHERIKSANEELARLDRLVSGLERGSDSPPAPQVKTGAEHGAPLTAPSDVPLNVPSDSPLDKAPAPESKVYHQGLKENQPVLRAFVGLLLAIGILGAAFASQYRDEAKAIMARWAPPGASPSPEVSEVRSPPTPPAVQLAAADEPTSVPAPPVAKEAEKKAAKQAENAPPPVATSPDPASAELTQSLKTITDALASINEKLEQQKSRNEQTLREQADAIQQLKTAQEKGAEDNARIAAQVQALQTQLTTLPAKPVVRSVMKENDTAARQRIPAAVPRRSRPPRERWMPPPYRLDPYDDPYW